MHQLNSVEALRIDSSSQVQCDEYPTRRLEEKNRSAIVPHFETQATCGFLNDIHEELVAHHLGL